MSHDFTPFLGTNRVAFGTFREEIRALFDHEYKTFLRNQFADNTTDFFESNGFFVEYGIDNKCTAIEFTNNASLYLDGVNLLRMDYDELRAKYDPLSSHMDEEIGYGATYYDLGFGVSRVVGQNAIETILIFSNGYWD